MCGATSLGRESLSAWTPIAASARAGRDPDSGAVLERLEMPPGIAVDYVFDAPEGRRALADLFEGRRQLLVQHFMLGPGWEQGCKSCSYMADHIAGMQVHLEHRDATPLVVARAPLAEIERFRQRMGWQFKWVSSFGNDFNYDFAVSFTPEELAKGNVYYNYGPSAFRGEEAPGASVFYKNDAGEVFHTYSTFGRGVEVMMGTYNMLDLTPKGRDATEPSSSPPAQSGRRSPPRP